MKPGTRMPARLWRVWTGSVYEETWAVSREKACANVAFRVRQRGAFPCLSQFTAEEVKTK